LEYAGHHCWRSAERQRRSGRHHRGTYTLLDDSCPNTITVRTKDLPPVGRAFSVSGVVLQDPNNANVPVIKELERADAGGLSASTAICSWLWALFCSF